MEQIGPQGPILCNFYTRLHFVPFGSLNDMD